MTSRFVAAKLFFLQAILFALWGVLFVRSGTVGRGLSVVDYFWNPLLWVYIPRAIPFAASILSVCFGFAYLGLEKKSKRSVDLGSVLVHWVSYVIVVASHLVLVRFWWRALGEHDSGVLRIPLRTATIEFAAIVVCCLAFGAAIFRSMSSSRVAE
jgi:hypothetical protein